MLVEASKETGMFSSQRLTEIMKEKGMSASTLARLTGVTPQHISLLKQGIAVKSPSYNLVLAMAKALDVDPLEFSDDPNFAQARVVTTVSANPARLDDISLETMNMMMRYAKLSQEHRQVVMSLIDNLAQLEAKAKPEK